MDRERPRPANVDERPGTCKVRTARWSRGGCVNKSDCDRIHPGDGNVGLTPPSLHCRGSRSDEHRKLRTNPIVLYTSHVKRLRLGEAGRIFPFPPTGGWSMTQAFAA